MRLLLDTHVWLWLDLDPARLSEAVREHIADPHNDVVVSVASLWEVVLKLGTGKLTLPCPPADYWRLQCLDAGFHVLDVEAPHVLATADLPAHHRDPFDRMLVAQAAVAGLTLVTADAKVRAYPVSTLAAER